MPNKIPVVGDEPNILNLTKIRLAMRKFEAVTASSGEEGLRKAQTEMPDLILPDVMIACALVTPSCGWRGCVLNG